MKAALYYKPRDLRLEEIPVPEIAEDEVLVKVSVALTCGTDVKTYQRGHPLLIKQTPSPFGHELAGEVAEVGRNVKRFQPGMRVVAANSAPCNTCFYCKINRPSLCEHLEFLNGAYAEYVKIPEQIVRQNLLPIPDCVSLWQAAICEPLACVLHGIDQSGINIGDTVVVIGAGPIGLMFVRLAKLRGAQAIVIGRNEFKLQKALRLGADEVISIYENPEPEKRIRELSPSGDGADVVIEAVGLPEVWERAIDVTRKGGTAIFFGGCESGTYIKIETKKLHYDEKRILGVFHHTPFHVARALELIAKGWINAEELITHEFPLYQLPQAFEVIEQHKTLKVAIYP